MGNSYCNDLYNPMDVLIPLIFFLFSRNASSLITGNLIYTRPSVLSILVQPSDGEVGIELPVQPRLIFLDEKVAPQIWQVLHGVCFISKRHHLYSQSNCHMKLTTCRNSHYVLVILAYHAMSSCISCEGLGFIQGKQRPLILFLPMLDLFLNQRFMSLMKSCLQTPWLWFCFLLFLLRAWKTEPRVVPLQGKCSMIELCPIPFASYQPP